MSAEGDPSLTRLAAAAGQGPLPGAGPPTAPAENTDPAVARELELLDQIARLHAPQQQHETRQDRQQHDRERARHRPVAVAEELIPHDAADHQRVMPHAQAGPTKLTG